MGEGGLPASWRQEEGPRLLLQRPDGREAPPGFSSKTSSKAVSAPNKKVHHELNIKLPTPPVAVLAFGIYIYMCVCVCVCVCVPGCGRASD